MNRRRQWHPTPVLLPGKSHGQRAWWAVVHGVAKSQTQLSDFTFTFHFHELEKEGATHSSVLAWRIPGTGEAGGLPSMGSHRVGHCVDWRDLAAAAGGSVVKNPPTNARGSDSIPGLGRCPGEGNGNPLQHSCLENSMNRGSWRAAVHGVTRVRYDWAHTHLRAISFQPKEHPWTTSWSRILLGSIFLLLCVWKCLYCIFFYKRYFLHI